MSCPPPRQHLVPAWVRALGVAVLLGAGPGVATGVRELSTGATCLSARELGFGLLVTMAGGVLGASRGRAAGWQRGIGGAAATVLVGVAVAALAGVPLGQPALVLPWLFALGLVAGLLAAGLGARAMGLAAAGALVAIRFAGHGLFEVGAGLGAALLGAAGLALVLGAPEALPTRRATAAVGLCALILGAAGRGLWPEPPELPPASHRLLASADAAAAVYSRAEQELQFWRGHQRVAGEGPLRPTAELLATCVGMVTRPGDRVLVFGLGSGRLEASLPRVASERVVDAFDWDAAAAAVRARLRLDGPLAAPWDASGGGTMAAPWPTRRVAGPVAALARLRGLGRDCLVVGEPLHEGADWQWLPAAQAALRAAVGEGVVLQPFDLARVDADRLRMFLGAAAAAHAWNAVFAVGDTAVLCSAGAQHEVARWSEAGHAAQLPESFAEWSLAARWSAHRAHLGGPADLWRACLGQLRPEAAVVEAERDGGAAPGTAAAAALDPAAAETARGRALAVLAATLQALPGRSLDSPERRERSLFAHWQALQTELRLAARRLRAIGGPDAAAAAQAEAARFLPFGAPLAELQVALGLPDAQGLRLLAPEAACRRAHAIDPTFFQRPPGVAAALPVPVAAAGALEDLAALPRGAALVAWCSGDDDRAVALRARFRSACAEALVEALAGAPLPPRQAAALRELVDPFVIECIGTACAARGAPAEVLGYWRGDLALPAAAEALWAGCSDDRCRLLAAAAGRRDTGSVALLARGMLAEPLVVRRCAAAALAQCDPAPADFDPDAPIEQRKAAAERWLSLHNRRP